MSSYTYLIVGGGMTADAAVRGIREIDAKGSIAIVGAEPDPPYARPPLSKGLWKGDPLDKVWRRTGGPGVELLLGRTITAIDPWNKRVVDDRKSVHGFDKLLLATGGVPRRLPGDDGHIVYFRTLDDYRRLRGMIDRGRRFAVIGGGFIGSEIAAALAMNGKEVAIVFPGEGIGAHVFPRDVSLFLNGYYRQKGVEVFPGETVHGVETRAGRLVLKTRDVKTLDTRDLPVDGIVAGLGIAANVELARAAKLAVGNGILVDESCRTSHPDVFAAGDVACFYNATLGMRVRVEHEDNATTMGRLAGRAMAGHHEAYRHLPFFYSDLFDLGYEAVGEVESRLQTVADWEEPFRKGVVYYMRQGRVRGVLLWNVWHQVDVARRLIAEPGPFRAADLPGRLRETG